MKAALQALGVLLPIGAALCLFHLIAGIGFCFGAVLGVVGYNAGKWGERWTQRRAARESYPKEWR